MSALHTFFDDYRRAFARADPEALAELFAYPVQVVSATEDAAAISVSNRDEWRSVLEGLLGAYRSLGVAEGVPVELQVSELTPRVSSVRVHWELQREDGSAIYDFTAVYTLAHVDGGWRACGIAHDEVPKLQAALSASPR